MKTNYNDYFSEEKINEFINKIEILVKGIKADLDSGNLAKGAEEKNNLTDDRVKLAKQKLTERVKADFDKGEEKIKALWMAIHNMDLSGVENAKTNITTYEYLDTLATAFFTNTTIRNDAIIKFLLTNTEISESNNLKANAIEAFLDIDNEAQWNDEIITLLFTKNELVHQVWAKNADIILRHSNISDEFLISFLSKYNPDINRPLIIKTSYDNGNTFHEEKISILRSAIIDERWKLAKWLADKGAYLLPAEISSVLWNPDISGELLVNFLKNNDVNTPFIVKTTDNQGNIIYTEHGSLLLNAINHQRLELTKWLVDQGADVNFSMPSSNGGVINIYNSTYDVEVFKVLVYSGRLLKGEDMERLFIKVEGKLFNLSDCHDILTWKKQFESNFVSFNTWFARDNTHYYVNLFKAFQHFSGIKLTYISQAQTVKEVQDKYFVEIIDQTNGIIPKIKEYFIENWHKSIGICNQLDHTGLKMGDIYRLIGDKLFDSYLKNPTLLQIVELTGEETGEIE